MKVMKKSKGYTPPEGWIVFPDVKPGATFHDIRHDFGDPVQFIKLKTPQFAANAVNLDTGETIKIDDDEYVYPVNSGLVAELSCYGFKISKDLQKKGLRAILAHVFSHTEARKENERWRKAIEKYLPSLGVMSFAGADRVVEWVFDQVEIKK